MIHTAAVPADNEPYIFVSYASADRERVLPLVDALARVGVPVWIDREGIHGGANYGREIAGAIKGAAALVLMASPLSLASRNVKQEIAVAWEYERPYLPLLLEAVAIPDDLKYWLTAAQWVEVLDKPVGEWLPPVLAALHPLGIAPDAPQREEVRLAGREKELALLRAKLVAAKEGRGGIVLIGGEAGIGKTTLAEAALAEAKRAGFSVLEGRCFDLAETPPYGPWIDLFAHYAATPPLPALPAPFDRRGTVGAVSSQMALFVAVEDFLAALTAWRPTVALLNDLHWSDPASLDLLRALVRSLATLPLLVLVTYRTDELTRKRPLYALLPQLAQEASAARIELGHLDDAAVRAVVAERYGLPDAATARLVTYLQGRAEGNALFVGELLRSLEEGGILGHDGEGWRLADLTQAALPPLLRQVIDGRLDRLDEESRRLLAIAAVIGHEVPLDVWTVVGEADEGTVLAVVDRGLEARLLVEVSGSEQVRFAHALIRETLYEGVPGIRRRRMHRRVGEALAEVGNPDPDAVAYHLRRANDPRALPWLIAAGERAQRAYARLTAADRFEAALELLESQGADAGERGWMLLRLGLLLRYADTPKALRFLDSAAQASSEAGDAFLAASVRCNQGLLHCYLAERRVGVALMIEAVEALDALPPLDADARGRAERMGIAADPEHHRALLALWLAYTGELRRARELAERAVARMPPPPATATVDGAFAPDAYRALGYIAAALGRPEEARAAYARNREALRLIGDATQVSATSYFELRFVALQFRTDDIAMRRGMATEIMESETRAVATTASRFPPEAWSFPLIALEGRWEEARRLLPVLRHDWEAACLLAPFARDIGEQNVARDIVSAGFPDGPPTAFDSLHRFLDAMILIRLGAMLAFDQDDLPSARRWLEAHNRWLDWSGAALGKSEGQALWAQYHWQSRDGVQARAHAECALAHASEPRQPLALLAAHRLLGEFDIESGTYDDAAHHLDASLQLADACEAPYERALTLLAMAEMRVAMGDANTARTLLNEVTAICERLGAKPALARADVLRATLGTDDE